MGRHVFHGQVAAQAASQSTDLVIKSQLDSGIATAQSRATHTGQQLAATISDFTTAVDARVQLIVDAAPAALDTLNELAAALGDDPNFSATVTSSIGALDTRIDALEAGGGSGGSFKQNIGDNAASSFTVTHNLATLDVQVEVVLISSGQTVFPVVSRTSANAISVDFGATVPASNAYRVLIHEVL